MDLETLDKLVQDIGSCENKSLNYYNKLIYNCSRHNEMEAVVYLYDNMLKNNIKPDESTFKYIGFLHSKTIKENNKIYIKNLDRVNKLKPRRRIHKIMKGHLYSKKYNNAKQHEEKVKDFLNKNNNYKNMVSQRIKLAKIISKNCDISFNDARFVITSLKRKKFFNKNGDTKQLKIENFFNKV